MEKKPSGIRDLIIHIFERKQVKPDAAQFKRWSVMLGTFIKPENPDLRIYTAEEMRLVIDYLSDKGIDLEPEHMYYSGLVASIVDGKYGIAQQAILQILDKQDRLLASDKIVLPSGW